MKTLCSFPPIWLIPLSHDTVFQTYSPNNLFIEIEKNVVVSEKSKAFSKITKTTAHRFKRARRVENCKIYIQLHTEFILAYSMSIIRNKPI